MAGYDDYDEFEDRQPGQGQGIRQYIKSLEDKVNRLVDQNQTLLTERRGSELRESLKAKGFDPIVADLIPADAQGDPAKVESWLGKYGAAFNQRKDKEATGEVADPPQPPQPQTPNPGIDPAVIQAQQRLDAVQAQALTPQVTQSLEAGIRSQDSPEAVMAALANINLVGDA